MKFSNIFQVDMDINTFPYIPCYWHCQFDESESTFNVKVEDEETGFIRSEKYWLSIIIPVSGEEINRFINLNLINHNGLFFSEKNFQMLNGVS